MDGVDARPVQVDVMQLQMHSEGICDVDVGVVGVEADVVMVMVVVVVVVMVVVAG